MKPWVFLTVFSVLSLGESAKGEILAEEDLEAIDSSPDQTETNQGKRCSLNASIGIDLERGAVDFPYGPPGLNNYKSKSGASGISLNLKKPGCGGARPDFYGATLSISNHFPADGRLYEVQAVSWSDFKTRGFVQEKLYNSGSIGIAGVIDGSIAYDRYQYARGTYSFQYVSIGAGIRNEFFATVDENTVVFGLDASISLVGLSRILTKYDLAKTSSTADATRVGLNSQGRVTGKDFEVGARLGFSSNPGIGLIERLIQPQHEIGLLWVTRDRNSQDFLIESDKNGNEISKRDLKMKSAQWILRWSEKI
jgi:hypothetical protein